MDWNACFHRIDQQVQKKGTLTTKDGTRIFYKNWGSKEVPPIVFHQGWPLSGDEWDSQMLSSWPRAFAS